MAVYLDYNASSPVDARVLDRMIEVYRSHYGNADSRTHTFGTDAKEIVENARKTIAEVLCIDSTDIIFTSGSTESNNMTTVGLLEYALESGRNHFITTSIEHKSILEAMKYLQSKGCVVDFVSPGETGRIKPSQILDLVTDKTLLVSMMHVNSETGIIQPIEEVGEALAGTKTYFHIDATQGFGKLNDSLRKVKYNMMSITAHKLGGPQGIGALILKRDKTYRRPPVKPLLFGGQQERGFRPGTTPVALVAGFALAVKLCNEEAAEHMKQCAEIKASLLSAIKELKYQVNGDPQYCISNTINISFSGVDAESYFVSLKDEYAFSNGSACNSGSHTPSYVLTAMGLDEKRISEAIRMSWDAHVNPDFSAFCNYIKSIV
ncbi:aminotransferase class V-fold PLP-dependent enzyme [Clostridium sp. MCC353]|uniref:cysteine desulfurase family protein n=1 Tax=Clostridium sp. MCC353 TaxID=2592646 RepID=UPI001C0115AB|nr:cysteine desulfurase family protein [Clostridium sp. MCC353]MBT9778615.1 aminotransferase class V-fold PLP-dependent enzyme [Clostridium sp. MCC353]